MKLTIYGEITGARVAEVLAEVAKDLGQDFGGFYKASITVQAFDKNGLEYRDIYRNEKFGRRIFSVPRGEVELPALTDAAKEYIAEVKQRAAEKAAKVAAEEAADLAKRQARLAKSEAEADEQYRRGLVFRELYMRFGPKFLDAVNDAILSVWQKHPTVFPSGKNKGEVRPPPRIVVHDGWFWISQGGNRSMLRIQTPVSKFVRKNSLDGAITSHWMYPEWKDMAVPKIEAVILDFQQRPTP